MGDVAMVAHAMRALRVTYPDLKVSILTKELFRPLFDGLDMEILPIKFDFEGRHKGLAGLRRLADEIESYGVDCVADLHNVLRTAILRSILRLKGIPSKHLHKNRFHRWMRMDGGCNVATLEMPHTVVRYCNVLRDLGFKVEDPSPAVKSPRPNPMPYPKGEQRWIGVAPFSAHEGKCYPLPLVTRVVDELSKRYDRVFIHSGPGAELEYALELERRYDNVEAVFGRMKLEGEIGLIANLDCLISMDSFTMHVASLVVTPTLSIWGATHPSIGFSGYGMGNKGFVQLELSCRPCSTFGNKVCRFGDYHCLWDITPESVVERVAELIEG
ncbi:MAG: glycosyltransferase family 9 protein [Rikenellaceae bacterium]